MVSSPKTWFPCHLFVEHTGDSDAKLPRSVCNSVSRGQRFAASLDRMADRTWKQCCSLNRLNRWGMLQLAVTSQKSEKLGMSFPCLDLTHRSSVDEEAAWAS